MSKKYDVTGVCNALVDILIQVEDRDLTELGLNKGIMHLVEADKQQALMAYFMGKSHKLELGGSAMNCIRTLATLGRKTVFAGMVSDDAYGQKIKERMHTLGIVEKLGHSREPTGSCVVLVTPDGERTMNTHLGASRLYTDAQIPHTEIAESKVLHFCGYQWDTDGQKKGISAALATAGKNDTVVSFDLADPFVVDRNRETFVSLIKESADVVFCNREEATMLFGNTPDEAARRIAEMGAVAVVKLGAEGALIRKGPEELRIKAVPTKVVDTTAAGDMFAAGFLYGFTGGKSLEQSGRIAAILAADVISRIGTSVSDEAFRNARAVG